MKKENIVLALCVVAIGLSGCSIKEKPMDLDTKAFIEDSIKDEKLEMPEIEEQMAEETRLEETVLEDTTRKPEIILTTEEKPNIERELVMNFYKDFSGVWVYKLYGDAAVVIKIQEDYEVRIGRSDEGKWHEYSKVKTLKIKDNQLELTLDTESIYKKGDIKEMKLKLSRQNRDAMVLTNSTGDKYTYEYDLTYDMEDQLPEGW